MNLRAVDLNLLTILDALLDEAHVSRAADRLGLSQPAASNALERCRHMFKDRLLERVPGGMQLTPRAQALRGPIKLVLNDVAELLGRPEIDLASLSQTVRVLIADHPAVMLARDLRKRLASQAPGLDLVIHPWQGAQQALDGLARGEIDLAVSVFPPLDEAFRRKELFREHYLVAMCNEHPAAKRFDLDSWLSYPHVLVSGHGKTCGALDDALTALGLARRVGVVVPSFLMAEALLDGSDLIAMLPSRCVSPWAAKKLLTFDPPIPVDGFALHLAWHRRRDEDTAVQYVARLIQEVMSPTGSQS